MRTLYLCLPSHYIQLIWDCNVQVLLQSSYNHNCIFRYELWIDNSMFEPPPQPVPVWSLAKKVITPKIGQKI